MTQDNDLSELEFTEGEQELLQWAEDTGVDLDDAREDPHQWGVEARQYLMTTPLKWEALGFRNASEVPPEEQGKLTIDPEIVREHLTITEIAIERPQLPVGASVLWHEVVDIDVDATPITQAKEMMVAGCKVFDGDESSESLIYGLVPIEADENAPPAGWPRYFGALEMMETMIRGLPYIPAPLPEESMQVLSKHSGAPLSLVTRVAPKLVTYLTKPEI